MLLDRLLGVMAPPRCAACDEVLRREAVFCAGCVATLMPPPPLPERVTASFAYGGALSDAIRTAKYRGRLDRLRLLGHAMKTRLPALEVDVVAPVPLHPARLRTRGYDQAAVLAFVVARTLGRRCDVDLVERVVDTPHLAELDAVGRARAVTGAFVSRNCSGRRVLLVDDVFTTGATLGAAFAAIEAAGGTARAHVLAATPRG